jgi:hypothetical protein
MPSPGSQPFPTCSALSSAAGEDLWATATQTTVFFLLEYRQAWGKKAVPESDLPSAVKTFLDDLAKSLPAAKFLLIKGPPPAAGLRFFVAVSDQAAPVVYEFTLPNYEAVLDLDFQALLSGASHYHGNRRQAPLYLVCTNGRRDACCARLGAPVYQALQAALGDQAVPLAWQVTHIGGHRFAANVLVLPEGLLYGRMTLQDVPALIHAHAQGHVLLEKLRGRSACSLTAQAAEHFLRCQTGQLDAAAWRLLEQQPAGAQQWAVRFAHLETGQEHIVMLAQNTQDQSVYESCSLDKQTPVKHFRLISIATQSPNPPAVTAPS